ncbi:hypothetical protein MTR67_052072 [Solanum verrucosum]|uniref:Uncharacterized protein n=1 Tax=Solanum verrucosum TaxID=315347 RepID=A0AAF0V5J7_SOLVR|nr:hypothetical protein MTR67_052072 [Solanum verrucosum]
MDSQSILQVRGL